MKIVKKTLLGAVSVTMILGMTLFIGGNICQAVGESYNTALEASYGDTFRSVYENRLAGSPLEAEETDGWTLPPGI